MDESFEGKLTFDLHETNFLKKRKEKKKEIIFDKYCQWTGRSAVELNVES